MKYRDYLEIAFRWYVFFFMSNYGLGKILGGQFYRQGQIPAEVAKTPIIDVSSYELAWVLWDILSVIFYSLESHN